VTGAPDPHGEDDAAVVVVQITPSGYRSLAITFVTLGVAWLAASVLLDVVFDSTRASPFLGVLSVGYGIYCARRARRQVTQLVVRIDSSGLRTGDGVHEHSWADVIMVWVGSGTGLRLPVVSQPVLSVFTRAGVDFARRAGLRPQARYTLPVGGRWGVPELCERLSRMTDATVVDGRRVSRRAAAAALRPEES